MQRFDNILVLYNRQTGDDDALERAIALAKANDAVLTVAETIDERRSRMRRDLREHEAHLQRFADGLRHHGVEARAVVLTEAPDFALTQQVVADGTDLVVLAAEPWRGLWSWVASDTARGLIRKCPCPVWIMQPGQGTGMRRVLAVVEPECGEDGGALDCKIIETASALARNANCQFEVLHAWDFRDGDRETSQSEVSAEIMDRLLRKNRARYRARVEALLRRAGLNDKWAAIHLPRGDAHDVIPAFVAENGADLVVFGARPRRGVTGLLGGGVAEDVLGAMDTSVLVVKPDDFVSPYVFEMDAAVTGRAPLA